MDGPCELHRPHLNLDTDLVDSYIVSSDLPHSNESR